MEGNLNCQCWQVCKSRRKMARFVDVRSKVRTASVFWISDVRAMPPPSLRSQATSGTTVQEPFEANWFRTALR